MVTLFNAGRVATRGLLAATLLSGTCAIANAQSVAAGSEAWVTLKGVVSVTKLAASQANREALQGSPFEKPLHRLQDGRPTSAPSRQTLDALPFTLAPNVGVVGRVARASPG